MGGKVPEIVAVPLADLLLDERNARLPEAKSSQHEVYHALAEQQGRKLLALAQDIVENGADPSTLVLVVATDDKPRRYKVLEGNRRVLAMKALENPSIVYSAFSAKADRDRLTKLGNRFAADPLEDVPCVLFDDEDDADHWIELRHTGENDGAGLVAWNANERDRHVARHGRRSLARQVIDFVGKHGQLSDEARNGEQRILTNVERLIKSPDVRRKIGLDLVNGQVVSMYPSAEIAKPLTRVIEDLRTQAINVGDIYNAESRRAYADALEDDDLPEPSSKLSEAVLLDELTQGATKGKTGTGGKPKRRKKPSRGRTGLIPRNCPINPSPPRINAVFVELDGLNVDKFPNACAVLLRVFVELSVDHMVSTENLLMDQERRKTPLAKRLKMVAKHLKDTSVIDDQLLAAVEKIANSQHVLAASVPTFNQYVHNQYVYPKPSELRTAWDELQPFLERIWP